MRVSGIDGSNATAGAALRVVTEAPAEPVAGSARETHTMKQFVIAAAAAVGLGLGAAGTADAQIVYGYTAPVGGGIMSGGTAYGVGGYQSFQKFYSPWSGSVFGQSYGANVLGQSYGKSFGYNPWTGMGYRTGFYQPGAWGYNPYAVYPNPYLSAPNPYMYLSNPYGGWFGGGFRRW